MPEALDFQLAFVLPPTWAVEFVKGCWIKPSNFLH